MSDRRSVVTEDGNVVEYIEYDDGDDTAVTVQIQLPVDESPIVVNARDSDGTVVYEAAYERRELSFDPITVLGLGDRTQLHGVSTVDDDTGDRGETDWYPPAEITTALNALGFAPVPPGEGWLNG